MFQPTHYLVSRSRKTAVQLVPSSQGLQLLTAVEFLNQSQPAFELRPHLGMFCKGIPVVGYALQPITEDAAIAMSSGDQPSQLGR